MLSLVPNVAGMQIGEAETKHFGPLLWLLWSEGGHRSKPFNDDGLVTALR